MTAIERVVAIDWSGDASAAGQRRKIWAGMWTAGGAAVRRGHAKAAGPFGGSVTLESGRTRDEVATWLIALARETPRMVVGFDFCFGFPEWFARGELGCVDGPAFWQMLGAGRSEQWLAAGNPDRRFWGRPHKRPEEFSGAKLHRMLRATDIDHKLAATIAEPERAALVRGIAPKSVFQIGGAGAVGTASLRGMPVVRCLRAAGFAVWPFDRPALKAGRPLIVEMYTRLNTGPVRKSNAMARAEYLRRKRAESAEYAALGRAVLAKARASEDAFDALVSMMAMTEHRAKFAALPVPRDPAHVVEGWTWAPGE